VSQNQNSKWYFGNLAGLDFMTTPPTILTNGMMSTQEGCASVSDALGNLLLYTDGITIWNRAHNIMANGSGLSGNSSTSQSGVVVKQPGNSNIYFVFTLGASGNANLHYSTVDMTLAAGDGSVIAKNILVSSNNSEKLTSVRHANGTDVWVLSHEGNSSNYRAYLVTALGVNLTAVVSPVGTGGNAPNYFCMKISPNGRKIAASLGFNSAFEILDFDNSTGIVSNPINLPSGVTGQAYGCEFSPDGTMFYGTAYNTGTILQWNLCAGSPTAIAASRYTVFNGLPAKGALQLAPDGKIYVSRYGQQMLGVINSPSVSGVGCTYVDPGLSISPRTCSYGLPNFITSGFKPAPPPFTYSVSNSYGCQTASFTAPSVINTLSITSCVASGYSLTGMLWIFGDPSSGVNNTSTLSSLSHAFTSLGTYTTQLILYYSSGGGTDTIKQIININQPCISVSSTSITCASLGSATVVATGGVGPYSYTWMPTAQITSVATGLSPGSYTLTVFDFGNNFTYTASTQFTSLIPLTGSIAASSSVSCFGASTGTGAITNLAGGSGANYYLWTNASQSISTAYTNSLSAGIWSVNVTDSLTGCQINQSFLITQAPQMFLNLSSSSNSVCSGGNIVLTGTNSGGTPGFSYTWTNGPQADTFTISQLSAGSYTYQLNSSDANNCLISNTIAINFVPNPTLTVGSVSICPLEFGVLNAIGATTYTWSNNSNGNSFIDNPAFTSQYSVVGSALGCTGIATASIILKPIPIVLISSNSPRCENTIAQLYSSGGVSYTWDGPLNYFSGVQNPTLNAISLNQAGVYNLTVTAANSCTASASTSVVVNSIPSVTATGATVCTSQTLNLTSNSVPGATFLWSGPIGFASNQQNPSIVNPGLNRSGIYFVRVTSAQGCTNIATAAVSVIPPPSLTVALSSHSLCFQAFNGSPNTITLTSGGANSYSLFTPDLTGSGNPAGPSTTVSTMPPYSSTLVLGTATIVGSNGVCTNSVTRNYSVIPNPTVVITPTPVICAGENYTYTSFGASSYVWTSSTPNFTTYNNGGVAVTHPSINSVFSVFGTSLGCNSASQTSSIQIIPLPVINLTPQQPTICLHEKTTLTANGTGTSFEWFPAEGLNNTAGMSVIASPPQTKNYTVVASANNCTNAANITVTVLALPQPTIINNKDKLCLDESINLKGEGGKTYDWFGPQNLFYSGQEINFRAASVHFSGDYTLTVTDENGCKGNTVTPIVIQALPQGNLGGFNENVCAPYCGDFSFLGVLLDAELTSTWQISNQTISSNSFSYCFSEAGTYTIAGRIFDAKTTCSNTVSYQIKVNSKPQADFYFSPLKPVEGIDEVIFTNASIGADQNKWNWFVNDAGKNTFQSENVSYKFDNSGLYTIAMVVSNKWNCADTAVRTIQVEKDFGMYIPNAFTPNNDGLNDEFKPVISPDSYRDASKYSLKVFDRWGHLIFESTDIENGWDGTNRTGVNSKSEVYAWRIEVTTLQGESKSLSGHVTLLR